MTDELADVTKCCDYVKLYENRSDEYIKIMNLLVMKLKVVMEIENDEIVKINLTKSDLNDYSELKKIFLMLGFKIKNSNQNQKLLLNTNFQSKNNTNNENIIVNNIISTELKSKQNDMDDNVNNIQSYNNLIISKIDNFRILDTIDKINDRANVFKARIIKPHYGDIWIKIAVWNIQSLNKKLKERYVKLEYIRDFFNDNKFDIIWLIDVNDTDTIILNGFNKYTDNRSILFVKDSIESSFTISKNLIFSEESKLAFIYITPNSNDNILLNNFEVLINNNYNVFGDFNIKSNKSLLKLIPHFTGEDSLQCGIISKKFIKCHSFAAPSDHRLVISEIKTFCKYNNSLRIAKIDSIETRKNIDKITRGEVPDFKPVVKISQTYFSLNDRENTINAMLNDYLRNNIAKVYKKYNYLWRFDRREPFLGKKVKDSVRSTYATHLKDDNSKVYQNCKELVLKKDFYKSISVKLTKSHAINDDFVSLTSITDTLNNIVLNPCMDHEIILNNIIKVLNILKCGLNAETFFLQKNKEVNTFEDVRVIIIIPTLIKMYESMIYVQVSDYISKLFNNMETRYQFGGIKGGSTFNAMIDLRLKMEKFGNRGVVFLDISKGYDNIDFKIMLKALDLIQDEDVYQVLYNWCIMVYNMDVNVNNQKIRKTRGIAMGLSLSPLMFILYVHFVLKNVLKDNLVMYIDDLAIVLNTNIPPKENLNLVLSIISNLEDSFLKINKKKTVVLTNENDIKNVFQEIFPIVNKEKYLGRLLGINGDGQIVNDDRFYNLTGFRSRSVPYWTNFFIKRIIGINALDAKLRYKMMMWATKDINIRTAVWKHTWSYFKTGMGCYSYCQLCFSCFNIFRYFIDPVDVKNWIDKIKNKYDVKEIQKEIKASLYVTVKSSNDLGMQKINKAIENIEFDLNNYQNFGDDPFTYTNHFLNDCWKKFQHNMLKDYILFKKESNIQIYDRIQSFVNLKVYNHFGILQRIAFKHIDFSKKKSRNKMIFEIIYLQNLNKEIIQCLENKREFNEEMLYIQDMKYDDIMKMENQDFQNFIIKNYEKLWSLLNNIEKIYKQAAFKVNVSKQINDILNNYEQIAFIDGSCIKSQTFMNINENENIKVGAGGILINKKNNSEHIFSFEVTETKFKELKHIGGEIKAAIEAINIAISKGFKELLLCFDYYGVSEYPEGNWKTSNKTIIEYINFIKEKKKILNIAFCKVPAHTGILYNEWADKLAKSAIGIEKPNGNENLKSQKFISESDKKFFKDLYRNIFRSLLMVEMTILNSNLNDLNIPELFFNVRVKRVNMKNLLDKQCHIMEEMDIDPLLLNYNDIVIE